MSRRVHNRHNYRLSSWIILSDKITAVTLEEMISPHTHSFCSDIAVMHLMKSKIMSISSLTLLCILWWNEGCLSTIREFENTKVMCHDNKAWFKIRKCCQKCPDLVSLLSTGLLTQRPLCLTDPVHPTHLTSLPWGISYPSPQGLDARASRCPCVSEHMSVTWPDSPSLSVKS